MAKPFVWIGKNADGETIKGEGYHEEDCRLRAASQGCVSFTYESNPEYTDEDEVQSLTPEVVSQSASDKISPQMTDVQHLAEANARMFEQLNTLKNTLVVAENTVNALTGRVSFLEDENTALKATNAGLIKRTSELEGNLTNLGALIIAWNAEQAAAIGEGYTEPAFVAYFRQIT